MNKLKEGLLLLAARKRIKYSREKMRQYSEKLLRKMLKHAYKNSPYYHRTFTEAGINLQNIDSMPIEKFPTVDKAIVKENFSEIVTVRGLTQEEIQRFDERSSLSERKIDNKYTVVHSSGSTGVPSYFIYDEKAWAQILAYMLRAVCWNMPLKQVIDYMIFGKVRVLYVAAAEGRFAGASLVNEAVDTNIKCMLLDINSPYAGWADRINEFQPNIIIGYPSAIKMVASLYETGKVSSPVARVMSDGEPLTKEMRKYLSEAFGCDVMNTYSSSESLVIGIDDGGSDGMYLFDDVNYIEQIDGKLYLTTLYNYTQPLIRYRMNDNIELLGNDQRFPYSRTKGVAGRVEDVMWFKKANGEKEFLHPLMMDEFEAEGVKDYQFIRRDDGTFTMRIELQEPDIETIKNTLSKQINVLLQQKELQHLHYDFEVVEKIMPDPKTGKKHLIIV